MVILPFQAVEPKDPRLHAGWEAEQQLAHFLDREFGNSRDILLLHGLRFPCAIVRGRAPDNDGDFAQIDHLILHPHGAAVVESKSVSGELRVDARDQWSRTWRSRSGRSGTENIFGPIEQARRQAKALTELLELADPPLLNKVLGIAQARFGGFPIRTLVAISEHGRFASASSVTADEVMKADIISRTVRDDINAARADAGFIGLIRSSIADREATTYNLTPDELNRISNYLLSKNAPRGLTAKASPRGESKSIASPARHPAPSPAPAPKPVNNATTKLDPLVCIKCASTNIEVVYRRDYCILCADCQGYTALGLACPSCGQRARIRKQGDSFFRDCDPTRGGCGASTLFWVNHALS